MGHSSLKEVAARAGVSFQTAGKVLNGKGTVGEETRERILRVAEELGYVPNAVARGLVTRSTRTIGIIASDLNDYVLARFVVGAEREARQRGHAVIIGSIDESGGEGEKYLRTLIEHRVDGIITAAPQLEEDERAAGVLRGNVPAVSIHSVPGGGITLVGSDHFQTGVLATEHLIQLGHRCIGTVTGFGDRRVTLSRLHGYRAALERSGVGFDEGLVEEGDWEAGGGYRAARRLLEREPGVTAIFAHNDMMAVGVLSALHDLGLAVPRDVAVVGCDDLPIAEHTIPPLTTVKVPFYETGETATRLLLDLISGEGEVAKRVILPVELVRRVSCGVAKTDGPKMDDTTTRDRATL